MGSKKDKVPFPEMDEKLTKEITVFSGNINKAEIKSKADLAISMVTDGNIDAIDMFLKTRALKEVCDEVLDGIKSSVIDKVYNLHKDERVFSGVKMELTEGSTTYSFDHCDRWQQLKSFVEKASKELKHHEGLMKNALEFETVFDGQGVQVVPAIIKGGTSPVLKVNIPK